MTSTVSFAINNLVTETNAKMYMVVEAVYGCGKLCSKCSQLHNTYAYKQAVFFCHWPITTVAVLFRKTVIV